MFRKILLKLSIGTEKQLNKVMLMGKSILVCAIRIARAFHKTTPKQHTGFVRLQIKVICMGSAVLGGATIMAMGFLKTIRRRCIGIKKQLIRDNIKRYVI